MYIRGAQCADRCGQCCVRGSGGADVARARAHQPLPLDPLPPLPDLSDAACLGSPLFDEETNEHLTVLCRVCARCPVRAACLDVALCTHPSITIGIWAGTTSADRAQLRADAGITFTAWSHPRLMQALTGEPETRAARTPPTPPVLDPPAAVDLAWQHGPTDQDLLALDHHDHPDVSPFVDVHHAA
jgi:hypothetical protein